MIDASTTWQQVSDALARSAAALPAGLPDHAASGAQEDFDAAFNILEAALGEADQPTRAQLYLYLASLHSLYGDVALTEMDTALGAALAASAEVGGSALYQALDAERQARRQDTVRVSPGLSQSPDPLTRYHVVAALALSGQTEEALAVPLSLTDLPPHLRWRLRSWQADCEENLGHTEAALHLYAEAAHLASGLQRAGMLQEQAALQLQAGQPTEALAVLHRARPLYPDASADPLGLASWHYLMSQAQLQQDQTDEALVSIVEADRLERAQNDPSYGVALVWGQVLVAQGRQQEALPHFEEALRRAAPQDRPYALHELGVALLDLDRPLEARERLESAALTPEYPFVPEVLADIAEAEYRLGRLQEAQATAETALSQGATVPASLVLGSVALDYYHLDEALEHYQRVLPEAAPGTRDWVIAQQMVADIMAQQGFPDPASAYLHAQLALEHTDPSDDWYATLTDHLARLDTIIGSGRGRTLN
ncbi:hypothetical protein [Deinococcus sonorensis]|uniref:Tetratricopeptide repeat protein n=2 Tax=Deinococcus sonorensis TaxID=309891 RepID=A0AAU7U8D3_9DEIO